MARREATVTISAEGRDKGKSFVLREMPADQAERWANRAILALANAGAKLPDNVLDAGVAGLELSWRNVLVTGLKAFAGLSWREAEPLLDEMKTCIKYSPAGAPGALQQIYPGDDSQVEEVATWYTLRYELLQLHLGFSLAAVLSTSGTIPQESPAS